MSDRRSFPPTSLLRLALLAGTACLSITAPALAQEAATGGRVDTAAVETTTAEVTDPAVESVVVTARRRDEDAQDVPIAISAFNGATLEQRRAYNVRDLQSLAPSLTVTVTNPRNTSVNIRGLGNNVSVYNDGLQPAVGVYVDQVYLGRPGQTVFDLADVQSIAVLRGPQGTLFGKDTSAGAVVVATREPSFTPEILADASAGNYDYSQAHLVVGGPLGSQVAGRFALAQSQRSGYATNIYTGNRSQDFRDWNAKGQILWTPNDDFKLRLIADYGQQRSSTASAQLTGYLTAYTDGVAYPFGYQQRAAAVGFTPLAFDPHARKVSVDGLANYWEEQGGVTSIADWTVSGATITSVTAARVWNWSPHNDGDNVSIDAGRDFHQANQQKQFSQELRVASSGERTLDYVAGIYAFWQDIQADAVSVYGSQAANWFIAPSTARPLANAALNTYLIHSTSEPEMTSYAAFAEGVWHATPRLDATLGLRYTHEKMTGYFAQTGTGQDISSFSAADQTAIRTLRARFGVANAYDAETSNGSVTGRINLSYKVTDDVLAYATYSRGYKAGGLNLSNINTVGATAVNPVVGPETIDAYELGVKSAWFDKRLTANVAAFWTDDSNYQTTQVNLINNVSSLTNAGSVLSRGVEVDLQAQPVETLSLYASTTFNDASYTDYKAAPCAIEIHTTGTCDLTDLRLPGVSKWAASVGGEFHAAAPDIRGDAAQAYVGADYSYRSNFFTTANDSIYSLIPAYGLLNLRAGVRAVDGSWDLQAWGRNVADQDYWLSLAAANTGAISGTLGDPRTFGVTLKVRH